jgi:hypothetical protein
MEFLRFNAQGFFDTDNFLSGNPILKKNLDFSGFKIFSFEKPAQNQNISGGLKEILIYFFTLLIFDISTPQFYLN